MHYKKRPCPFCGSKKVELEGNPWWPFCSKRCKMIDLGHWAMGTYKVAGEKISTNEFMSEGEPDEEGAKK